MSLEKHVKTSKELYENEQRKLEEKRIHQKELDKRENELKIKRAQREKEYEIRILESKKYTLFKGDQTGLFGIGRLFTETFIAKVGDFEYSEHVVNLGGSSNNPNFSTSVHFSYKGIETETRLFPLNVVQPSCIYFSDWDLTIPTKLMKDAENIWRLKNL